MDPVTASPAEPPVSLTVEVEPRDYEAFCLHVAFRPRMRARWRRQFIAMYGGVLVLLVGANLYTFGLQGFDPFAHLIAPALILAAFAVVFTPLSYVLHRWNVRRTVRAMLGKAPRDEYLGTKRIEATAEGIAVLGAASQSRYAWTAVTGVEEADGLMMVMLGETMAILVPMRDQPAEAIGALRAAIRRHQPVA